MAGARKHLRSSTAHKRPTTAIEDGQIAVNTNATSPGLFVKDSTGASILKIGPAHVGATAPNSSPAAGGSTGNSIGESWLDTSLTPVGDKVWNGTAWINTTPASSTTVQGLVELATNAETQAGSDAARAVTPASLQSKVSDSTSTTSSTTIASSTAVKAAYDLANAALPASGGTITGSVVIGNTGSIAFEGSTDDAFETSLVATDPTADRTITFPDRTGTVITTGDTGTVTSTMIADGTIVDADINAGAAIAGTKISPNFGSQNISTTGTVSAAALIPTGSAVPANGVYLPAANEVGIAVNGVGAVRIDSGGRLYVNSNTPSVPAALLHVDGTSVINRQTATTNDYILDVRAGNSNQFRVRANGTLYAVSTTIQALASERRLKENIVPIDGDVAWNTIKSTPFYSYNFKGSSPESVCYGPMADEVPYEMRVDTGNLDDVGPIHTYDNGMLQARLYVALQTALERIETLEAKVAALEAV